MLKHVIILGGGVAGMSAAHELAERGFKVTVFEKQRSLPGGKARSIPVEGTAAGGREPLPGEHGFRFFPGFYKHIIDTMERIPFTDGTGKRSVCDNLIECPNMILARMDKLPIVLPNHFPRSFRELKQMISRLLNADTGLEPGEQDLMTRKLWQLMTSCKERRINEYERIGWWEFTEADRHSKAYQTLFADGLTRTLVAARAETCNTKTNGDVLVQLLFNMGNPAVKTDRILCGPTNEKWLFPWLTYLQEIGVEYHFDSEVFRLETDVESNAVTGVVVKHGHEEVLYSADYYLCALPVERAAELVRRSALHEMHQEFNNIIALSKCVAWMNGMQFFLREDVSLEKGHVIMADTPWALTAISQVQFWNVDIRGYGNGEVGGIISVDVSNWERPGILYHKPADRCTKKEAIAEVWEQLKRSVNVGQVVLADENLVLAYVDGAIIFENELAAKWTEAADPKLNEPMPYGSKGINRNEEPLLVNEINTWAIRSDARTAVPNLFLASDYVRTHTDLATMEGANEAARRAVNNILEVSGSGSSFCRVWELDEPDWLLYYKRFDQRRYVQGLPWKFREPWFAGILNVLLQILKKLKLY